MGTLMRSRWAAIGAAVAVTLGAGGLFAAQAGVATSVYVSVTPARVLDTRAATNIGLSGPFTSESPRKLQVTGAIDTSAGNQTLVPIGATSVVYNLTVVNPSAAGFVALRPGDASGLPKTSSINFAAGSVVANGGSVTLTTAGVNAGQIDIFFKGSTAGATADVLVDIAGYYTEGAGTAGPKGDTGPTGDTGLTGDTGPRGYSAWDTIPSGVTVMGYINWNGEQSVADNEGFLYSVDFPAVLPSDLGEAAFGSDSLTVTTDDDAACAGSFNSPSAPPGMVCGYYISSNGIDNITLTVIPDSIAPRHVFGVRYQNNGTGNNTYLNFSWAYTAP